MNKLWDIISGRPEDKDTERWPRSRRPSPGETLQVWALESSVGWYWTHFMGRRTKPCLKSFCVCQRQGSKLTSRWQGWILAYEKKTKKVVMLALTDNVYNTTPTLKDPKINLRGALISVTRQDTGDNGVVTAEVDLGNSKELAKLKLPYTQRDCLDRMWFKDRLRGEGLEEWYAIVAKIAPDEHAADLQPADLVGKENGGQQ